MQNNELETIGAAMQDAIHRAYALGRTDALRRVVEMVQKDELGSKAVALLGPADVDSSDTAEPEANVEQTGADATSQTSRYDEPQHGHPVNLQPAAEQVPAEEPLPWWRRPL